MSDKIYDALDECARASTRKEKQSLLCNIPPRVLKYAYHPHIKFYVNVPEAWLKTTVKGTTELDERAWTILDMLATGKYRGQKAKALIRKYIQVLTPKSRSVFARIINKDLRAGIAAKTINTVYHDLIPEEFCMLCHEVDWKKVKLPVYVSYKVDGDRCSHIKGDLFSRSGRIITGFPYIQEAMRNIQYGVDGELRNPSLPFAVSSGHVRSNQKYKPGYTLYIFDLMIDRPYENRQVMLKHSVLPRIRGAAGNHIQIVPSVKCETIEEILDVYRDALQKGFEGIVLKTPRHKYQFARSYDWMRLVPYQSADCTVISTAEGTGKHAGKIGALWVMFQGKKQKVGTGLSDPDRERDDWVGATVEVKYKGLTNKGKMRQPRVKARRYDK